MSMENHGGIISTRETPDSSARAFWQSYQQSHLVAGGIGEENNEFVVNKYLRS
jgi:hypothetical protein